jgi:hypothetical protein
MGHLTRCDQQFRRHTADSRAGCPCKIGIDQQRSGPFGARFPFSRKPGGACADYRYISVQVSQFDALRSQTGLTRDGRNRFRKLARGPRNVAQLQLSAHDWRTFHPRKRIFRLGVKSHEERVPRPAFLMLLGGTGFLTLPAMSDEPYRDGALFLPDAP